MESSVTVSHISHSLSFDDLIVNIAPEVHGGFKSDLVHFGNADTHYSALVRFEN